MSTEELRRKIDTCHRRDVLRTTHCSVCALRWPCDIARISETLGEACDEIDRLNDVFSENFGAVLSAGNTVQTRNLPQTTPTTRNG